MPLIMNLIKKSLLFFALLLGAIPAFAQNNPVAWSTSTEELARNKFRITFTASIERPWHMYDLGPYTGGPNATAFTFEASEGVTLDGPVRMITTPTKVFDEIFRMEIGYFDGLAKFSQDVTLSPGVTAGKLGVLVEWMVCDDKSCLPPDDKEFTVELSAPGNAANAPGNVAATPEGSRVDTGGIAAADIDTGITGAAPGESPELAAREPRNGISLWNSLIQAILWGFAALLTPCVFPMIPMTITFFLKGNKNPAQGKFLASFYGLSIVALYTLPIAAIILITRLVGGDSVTADLFNWLATHWFPNVMFFFIFMIFAASFFGAFEITMPSWLVSKSDQKSDKGGILGTFFMATTLVLVSFSCTGPIVGTVLIKSTTGEIWDPVFMMLAFSIAFALPFTLLALFPAWLQKLPKSGGWLNSVKVSLGFVEIALGLKFLSIADQTYHWGLLDREVYLALWIVTFSLLGFYLLGKIRFKNDSKLEYIGVTRLALSIITLSFVVYMIPGMWGAPLKGLSGYIPPMHTQDFVLGGAGAAGTGTVPDETGNTGTTRRNAPKHSDFLHLPHNLSGFFDYEEGMEYARQAGKPVFLDYTGHGCVNCREMEARVWSDPRVLELLRNEYVIIALYSDDKKQLPESDWVTTSAGKTLKGLGKINSYFAQKTFGISSQPYYLLLDHDGNLLVPGRGYNLSIEGFVTFLEAGISRFAAK